MTPGTFLAFWAVSIMFVIIPGADWTYAITAGMKKGAIVPAISGLLLGHLAATLIVAAGIGALVARIPLALHSLTFVGAAYLIWLGVHLLIHPPVPSSEEDSHGESGTRWAMKGFAVSGLNPKVFLLFLALLPQFTDPGSNWPIPLQICALGAVHVLSCGVVYFAVGLGSRWILCTRPGAGKAVGRISGCLMVAFALLLMMDAAKAFWV